MQEENKTFLVVGSFQSGKSELVRYFGEDAREFNFYPTTNYEYKYSLTTHPKQHTYLFHDEIITFIDTPGHSDFLHETLTLLRVIKNVILVLNFEENIEILHFDLLDDLKDKNVYLIFNKTDVSFKNGLKSEEIKEIIKNIRLYIKIKDIFIASAKDAWIYKYDYLYCKSSEVGFIYNLKRIKKRYAMDKFRASNSFLYQVKRFLVPEKEDTLFLYVFKKYFFREQMVTLIYSNFVIKVGEEYDGYKVKKIIIDFSELKDTLENVPSFVIFDKEVRNDTFLVGREDYQSKNVPTIYKVNLLDNNLFLEVKKFKDIFLNLNFGESVISAPSELIFDAFFNDFCQFKYKKILLREAGIKEKRIYNKKEKKGDFNFLEKNNFSFLIEKNVSFLNPLLTKVNNHSFYNSTMLIDPFVLSEVIKVFEFIFSELEVYENDELISLNVTLIHAITNKKYQESIYEDAKEALIEELNSHTEKKSIFLSVKIFYEELVHDILVDNFTFLNYYKLLSSKYCVVKTMIKNEELIGFDNKVFDLTLGKAVCIKKFHGFE